MLTSAQEAESVPRPTLAELSDVWKRVCDDPDAHKALVRLERDGFAIIYLDPRDPTFKQPTWADYVAALPFLPNRPARRQLHRPNALRKYLPLVNILREFGTKVDNPFCEKHIVSIADCSIEDPRTLAKDLLQTAELLKKVLSWSWYTREKNPRNALIAELRSTIRSRTGNPHDRELAILVDAAFRAAGIKEGLYLDATALERIEKREKEGRVKATCWLNYISGLSPTPQAPKLRHSTTFPRNRGKRV